MIHAPKNHDQIRLDSDLMRDIPGWFRGNDASGLAYGKSVLSQDNSLVQKTLGSTPQDDFKDRNLWSLYNAFTESLKTCQAQTHGGSHRCSTTLGRRLRQIACSSWSGLRKLVSGVELWFGFHTAMMERLQAISFFHSRRPRQSNLNRTNWRLHQDDQCYNGTLENGTITVCSIKHFIESVPIRKWLSYRWQKRVNSLQVDDPSKGKTVPVLGVGQRAASLAAAVEHGLGHLLRG